MKNYCMGRIVRKEINGDVFMICESCGHCYSVNTFYAPMRCEREIIKQANQSK